MLFLIYAALLAVILVVLLGNITSDMKINIHNKLEQFASTHDNLEDTDENLEQIEVSRYFESQPKPSLIALNEFLEEETQFRYPEEEDNKLAAVNRQLHRKALPSIELGCRYRLHERGLSNRI